MLIKEMAKDPSKAMERCKEAYAKAEKVQPALNAMITFIDPEEQVNALGTTGKFLGVPVVLKDNVSTKGTLTTAGSRIRSDERR